MTPSKNMDPPHSKCRFPNHLTYKTESGELCTVVRKQVPDTKVSWNVEFTEYSPDTFTAPQLDTNPHADPDINHEGFNPHWNHMDSAINRISHEGVYKVQNGMPRNIRGRTGLCGRGVLPRYGPNHAADCIVTRWKRDNGGNVVAVEDKGVSSRKVLQFLAIQRKDNDDWALPGGKVDPGESVDTAAQREFIEEALNGKVLKIEERSNADEIVADFFAQRKEVVYQGYVDDPRNTDCAWMETTAFLFHDSEGDKVAKFDLKAGDDAKDVRWMDASGHMELFASHKTFVLRATEMLNAHW